MSYVAILFKNLIFIFPDAPFIVRVGEVSVVRERTNLFTTQRRAVLFAEVKVTFLYELLSPMYYLQVTCTFPLTSNQFESLAKLDQNQYSLCLDLQNFKSVESGDVHQNILSSETWALGLQNLQAFRCWRRSSELLSSESSALDQKHNLQKLGLFIRTSCLRIFSLASGQIIRAFRR